MRVLHVDPERGWGGGEVQVSALVRQLAAWGHEVVVAADPAGRLGRHLVEAAIRVAPLRVASHADLVAGLRLRRLAQGHDVVHFHTARAHALAPLCRGAGRRLVVTRRMDYRPRGGPYARFLYNRAVDAVIAISGGVRSALVAAGVDPARIRVVPSGIDIARWQVGDDARATVRREWGVGPEHVLVVALGALVDRKGHHVLLEAAKTATAGAAVRFVFVGDGERRCTSPASATTCRRVSPRPTWSRCPPWPRGWASPRWRRWRRASR